MKGATPEERPGRKNLLLREGAQKRGGKERGEKGRGRMEKPLFLNVQLYPYASPIVRRLLAGNFGI